MKRKVLLLICILLMSASSVMAKDDVNANSRPSDNWMIIIETGLLIVAIVTLIVNGVRSRTLEKRKVYQQLEFASIDLFRFEIEKSEKTWRLYNEDFKIENEGEQAEREIINHATQLLNLFEMSVELHRNNIFDHQIFCTWLIWIFETAELKPFQYLWKDDLKNHYTGTLGDLINYSIETINNGDDFGTFTKTLCKKRLVCKDRKLPCIEKHCKLAKYLKEHNEKFCKEE